MNPIFNIEIEVRWHDLDALGHVNHTHYFTYFEHARIKWWQSLGYAFEETQGPVLVAAEASYLKPVFYPETLLIQLALSPPGKTSYTIFYEALSKNNPQVIYAKGSTKIVWVDYQLMKPVPLPDFILKHLPEVA